MKAYVICLNDFPEFVVLDDYDLAKKKMGKFKKEYSKKHPNITSMRYWHIKEVGYTTSNKRIS